MSNEKKQIIKAQLENNQPENNQPVNALATLISESPITNGVEIVKESDGTVTNIYRDSYVKKDGTLVSLSCADPKMVGYLADLRLGKEIDKALALRKFYACYYLSENYTKVSADFKSWSAFAETLFNIKGDTAKAYAKVGKYFLKEVANESGNGTHIEYVHSLLEGASGTNLQQILSLVREDAENPIADIIDYIRNGKLHIAGTLSVVKSDVSDIKTDVSDGKNSDSKKGNKGNKGNKNTDDVVTLESVITDILKLTEKESDSDKKAKLIDIVAQIESIYKSADVQ